MTDVGGNVISLKNFFVKSRPKQWVEARGQISHHVFMLRKVYNGMRELEIIDKVRLKVEQKFFLTYIQEICAQVQEFVKI